MTSPSDKTPAEPTKDFGPMSTQGGEAAGAMREGTVAMADQLPWITVLFHRDIGFYPIEVPRTHSSAEHLAEHARLNPGTLKITDALTGETLWEPL